MKEKKFRAWDGKQYLYSDDLYSMCATIEMFGDKEKIILQQYTGLKDRNGKEIYEGDILNSPNGNAQVVFENGAFRLKTWRAPLLSSWAAHWEVVGNIYDNPKLIK